jgi:2-dehydro-3-deoxyphosphogluconate aldolase/(4S)-4-hydroxy-2-oxoglutarate aldolase
MVPVGATLSARTGDRHETEANHLTELAARPAIPPGLLSGGVVAIGRHVASSAVPAVAEALRSGGVRAFELTLNEPEDAALASIEAAADVARDLGLEIGAGTVLTIEAATRALDAGATFLVMPHLDQALVAWAAGRGIPTLPGCATPTEILAAWRAGAAAVKLFPASAAGAGFVREMRGPFPEIPLVPTGGVTVETAPAFIAAGAVAVGMGGWLLGDGEPAGIRDRAAAVVDAVAGARERAAR